ncbi:LAMI_0G09582g1_1 [Lachancea mirantina]|uniref:LAMI_0G09582g1_1 n=1 Tax=Lachancea mirantina TaxID=1230905 RepID=A0A1G4KAC6_9SACH|nr:LAMI_0G09582g1_1 [Lachancea mirantina]
MLRLGITPVACLRAAKRGPTRASPALKVRRILFHSGPRCASKEIKDDMVGKPQDGYEIEQNKLKSRYNEKDFSQREHIHMKESETEENDSFQLGSMLHREGFGHHHHQNTSGTAPKNPLLIMSAKEFRQNPGVRITWVGLLINVGLALGKFVGGIVFHSQALVADSVHAASDLISDFLTLFSVGLASRKPSSDFPYGYGKIETLGSLAVSSILATAGLSIGWTSLTAVAGPLLPHAILEFFVGHGHSHSHSIAQDVTNINAAWIAGGSILVKEWIFKATKKVAEQTNSNVLLANAWHHRVDSLTSLVALVTITSGYFLNIQTLDAFGGLIVSVLVLKAGIDGCSGAIKELIDKSIPHNDPRYKDIEDVTRELLSQMISNNNAKKPYSIADLVVLTSGPNIHAKLVLEAPIQRWENVLTLKEFEIVTDHLRGTLYQNVPNLRKVDVEFIEEKPQLTDEEAAEIEKQKNMGQPPLPNTETQATRPHQQCGHNHSHFGLDKHIHKH